MNVSSTYHIRIGSAVFHCIRGQRPEGTYVPAMPATVASLLIGVCVGAVVGASMDVSQTASHGVRVQCSCGRTCWSFFLRLGRVGGQSLQAVEATCGNYSEGVMYSTVTFAAMACVMWNASSQLCCSDQAADRLAYVVLVDDAHCDEFEQATSKLCGRSLFITPDMGLNIVQWWANQGGGALCPRHVGRLASVHAVPRAPGGLLHDILMSGDTVQARTWQRWWAGPCHQAHP